MINSKQCSLYKQSSPFCGWRSYGGGHGAPPSNGEKVALYSPSKTGAPSPTTTNICYATASAVKWSNFHLITFNMYDNELGNPRMTLLSFFSSPFLVLWCLFLSFFLSFVLVSLFVKANAYGLRLDCGQVTEQVMVELGKGTTDIAQPPPPPRALKTIVTYIISCPSCRCQCVPLNLFFQPISRIMPLFFSIPEPALEVWLWALHKKEATILAWFSPFVAIEKKNDGKKRINERKIHCHIHRNWTRLGETKWRVLT